MSNIDPAYKQWIIDLKEKVWSAKAKAAEAVNAELILLYWDLGQMINEKQTAYGTGFLQQLSKDLMEDFPQMKGFSSRNLKYCRNFFQFYNVSFSKVDLEEAKGQQPVAFLKNMPDASNLQQPVANLENIETNPQDENKLLTQYEIRQQLVAQIPWGHNILIFTKSVSIEEAQFYTQQTIINGWSRNVLSLQIKINLFLIVRNYS